MSRRSKPAPAYTLHEIGVITKEPSDAPPDRYERAQGFSVSIQIPKPQEAERIFNALAEGGKVQMPIQETFWAVRFGMLVDRFGTPWMINCARPEMEGKKHGEKQ